VGLLAELAHSFDDQPRAGTLYERLSPYADQIAVAYPEISTGSVSRYLGLLAATMRRWDEAERHLREALAANERIGAHPWLAQTQEDYACLLRRLDRPGDDERARELFDRALQTYSELGMDSYAARIAAHR